MTFEINKTKWKLEFVTPSSQCLVKSDGTYTIGVTDNAVKTVYIAEGMDMQLTNKVLCHELCHVFSFENKCSMDVRTEEIVADFMSLYGRNIIYLADDIIDHLMKRRA